MTPQAEMLEETWGGVSGKSAGLTPANFSWRRLLHFAGPSLLMSAAFVDPGNLEGDLQVGIQTRYSLLWLMLSSTILAFIIQMLAAKLGVVTGKHLAEVCRSEYPSVPRYFLWLMMEMAIIGSDIQEVVGSSIAIYLLSCGCVPLWGGAILTAMTSFLLLYLDAMGPRVLEGLFGLLISTMAIAFVVLYAYADINGVEVLKGLVVPSLPSGSMNVAVGLVGSIIMPHNIYLHSAVVLNRDIDRTSVPAIREAMFYFSVEVCLTLVVTVLINTCVISVFASASFPADIGLANAGEYLGHHFGEEMVFVWALGLIGSGQSSVMAGGYAGQYVMDGFLNLKVSKWLRLGVSRSLAIVPTLCVALMYHNSWDLDTLNEWLNVLQAVQIPFALIPVLVLTSKKRIMGQFANTQSTNVIVWAIGLTVLSINFASVFQLIKEGYSQGSCGVSAASTFIIVLYIVFMFYMIVEPCLPKKQEGPSWEEPLLPTISTPVTYETDSPPWEDYLTSDELQNGE
ncbi:unnamed protein product [Ostreobium quekettii]|uniref:Uncharacterized protein n=1 Tax=Ostreobium quekettii TaxID=121088 RepID=A0A8S1JGR9_9CHLO|nr:unnamed protein product [Ostreobium quekettii]|eukprot:evm.model.scf_1416.1 EVM.evm.TU.scf_1416.1   scf_1416:32600-39206(-)